MAKASPGQLSFNAGELSPLAAARTDSEQYGAGLKTCINYALTTLGPATHRPGTYLAAPVKDSSRVTRVIRFEFSTTQAYIIEFGHLYCRFYRDNAQVTLTEQNITGITQANPAVVTYDGADTFANDDRVVIAGVVGMTEVNNREFTVAGVDAGANTFQLSGVDSTGYTAYTSGGTVAEIYEIATPYTEADLFALDFKQSADVLYITGTVFMPRKLSRTAHTAWTLTECVFIDGPYLLQNTTATTLTPDVAVNGAAVAVTGAADNGSGLIRITAVAHGFATGNATKIEGVTGTTEANGHWLVTVITADTFDLQGSAFVNAYVSGGTSSRRAVVTASAVTGINGDTGFKSTDVGRLIRMKQGGVWGYVRIAKFTSTTAVIADVFNTLTSTAAKLDWRLGAWSDTTGYPGALTFYEDRLVFGGAPNEPHRIDGSKTGVYENMSPTGTDGVVANDNAISFTLNASSVNRIYWLEDDESGLLIGTTGGCWAMRASIQNEALTPTNVSAKRFTGFGSKYTRPVRSGRAVLYVQRDGRVLREITYGSAKNGYTASDVSIASGHITKGGMSELAYQQYPHETAWAVRADGTLLGMLHSLPENSDRAVRGWHRHLLGGSFGSGAAVVESLAVIPSVGGSFEQLWMVVKRTINGATVRTIEYMTRFFESGVDVIEDAFFVDCGLTYSGPAADVISGLWHLNGQTVSVLADGSAHPNRVVDNGKITLDRLASIVHVGLYRPADGETLIYEAGAKDGTAQGKTQRIHGVTYRLDSTVGMQHGPNFSSLKDIIFRTSEDTTGAAIVLFTGDKYEMFDGNYSTAARICWRQALPMPSTIIGIYPQIVTQDRQ